MSLLFTILSFLGHILSGEAFSLWKEHKLTEAIDAKNKANSLSDADAINELRDEWTRK